jgi:hypothetical protein
MSFFSVSIAGAVSGWVVVMTALVAALTIGGKAAGKRLAIDKSNSIVFFVGKVISYIVPVK